MVAVPQYLGMNLSVEGTGLKNPVPLTVAPRLRRVVVHETPYQHVSSKTDTNSTNAAANKKENIEKKRKPSIKLVHKEPSPLANGLKGKKTPVDATEKTTPTHLLDPIAENKSFSEPSSAKVEKKEGLLLKRKRNSSKSMEMQHKAQLDLMKPTDSYLRKIKEGKQEVGQVTFMFTHQETFVLPELKKPPSHLHSLSIKKHKMSNQTQQIYGSQRECNRILYYIRELAQLKFPEICKNKFNHMQK